MRLRNTTLYLFAIAVAAPCAWCGPVAADVDDVQQREAEQVEPGLEAQLRFHLQKLGLWGVSQLMRTEQKVDREQKRRASMSTNPRELSLLADDEDSGVRFYVAANRHTPLGTKIHLALDPEVTVRSGVAMSLAYDPLASSTTRTTVTNMAVKLAQDENVLVRLALAENARLPEVVFETLAVDPDFLVRRKLIDNLDVPQPVLALLAADSVGIVSTAALSHRNLPIEVLQQMAADPSAIVRRAVCRNVNTPLHLLDAMAADTDPEVRRLTAAHPNTPLATLRALTRDGDVKVLLAVAHHPHADRSLLTDLAYDERAPEVRLAAQHRLKPLLRREIRDDILERW